MTTVNTFETDQADDSFPYVLVSSLFGALASLAAVWAATAATFVGA